MKVRNSNNSLENPLVSIIVITYNSSKYVLETLESAKSQTYKNIELIISDDCSTDDTREKCEIWLEENNEHFASTKLVTTFINTGIPGNANRGINASKGTWIKLIAGDDVLIYNGIENLVTTVTNFPNMEILLSQVEIFNNNFNENNVKGLGISDWQIRDVLQDNTSPDIQIEYLLKGYPFPGPGFFIKKDLLISTGGYSEKYPLIEDMPFCLKVLFENKIIFFRPIITVKYRKHSENLTGKSNSTLASYHLQSTIILFKGSIKYGKMKFIIINTWNLIFVKTIFMLGNKGKFCLFINKIRIYAHPRRFFSLLGI